jgi:hypothetical protein
MKWGLPRWRPVFQDAVVYPDVRQEIPSVFWINAVVPVVSLNVALVILDSFASWSFQKAGE